MGYEKRYNLPGTIESDRKDKRPRRHPLLGICFFFIACAMVAAFVDYVPAQSKYVVWPVPQAGDDMNVFGPVGANSIFLLYRWFGCAAWIWPFIMALLGLMMWFPRIYWCTWGKLFSGIIMMVSSSALLEFFQGHYMSAEGFLKFSHNRLSAGMGGCCGYYTFRYVFEQCLGNVGSAWLLGLAGTISGMYFFSRSGSLDGILEQKIAQYGYFRAVVWENTKKCVLSMGRFFRWLGKGFVGIWRWGVRSCKPTSLENTEPDFIKEDLEVPAAVPEKSKPSPVKEAVPVLPELPKESPKPSKLKPLSIVPPKEDSEVAPVMLPKTPERRGNYTMPGLELLQHAQKVMNEDDHEGMLEALVNTLAEFGIAVNPGEVHVGPVITRYEISPAPGVRVEKIVNLDKNIALNLRAQSVRILAPVPGKGCVGVEIPNKNPQMVCLREILESPDWMNKKCDIPVVLGRKTTGEPMIADLAKMPHLLIAGSTGSGKTVCINAIIASLLYHATPQDLRLMMVDPKIVEMQVYNDLPHMLVPVLTDPKKVPNALNWLISEMERRYHIFAKVGVRNIAGFNAKILKDLEESKRAEELERLLSPEERSAMSEALDNDEKIDIPKQKLPYIICIIDELADLMMVAPSDIETSVARLAQLARAAGIHLILATQRPSVNVITGIIKANLPSRIAFKVASKVDSRTILDAGGAEALIGRGDMLFQPPGASGFVRAQGALVSDEEINGIVEFLHDKNGGPDLAMDVHDLIERGNGEEGMDGGEDWEDEMMPKALEVLRNSDRASTSLLQRRLKIGYNRAARIMEALEERGLVNHPRFPEDGE